MRVRWLGVKGTLSVALTDSDVTLYSDALADLPEITGSDYAVLVLDPNGVSGRPETVYVTAHTASDTTATITRGEATATGGSVARAHSIGVTWLHAPVPTDFVPIPDVSEAGKYLEATASEGFVWSDSHLVEPVNAHWASSIGFDGGATPGSNLAATDVQTALEELDSEKQEKNASTTELAAVTNPATITIGFVIDGGGSTITTGQKGHLSVPFACTLNQVTLLADQSGSIVVDIWKDTYANFPPIAADSITNAAKPTISAATKSQDSTLTGWTRTIAAGDVLAFNVDSVTTCQRVLVSLRAVRA